MIAVEILVLYRLVVCPSPDTQGAVAHEDLGDAFEVALVAAVVAGDHDGGMEPARGCRPQLVEERLEEHPWRQAGQPGVAVADGPGAPRRMVPDLMDVPEERRRDDTAVRLGGPAGERMRLQGIQSHGI